MNRIVVFLVLMVAAFAVTADAQVLSSADSSYLEQFRGETYRNILPRVWLNVCALNQERYPDLDVVHPGDTILLPLGRQYVAKAGDGNHVWQASAYFTNMLLTPYLTSEGETNGDEMLDAIREQSESGSYWSVNRSILWIVIVVALGTWTFLLLYSAKKRRKPFAWVIPSFTGASDDQVRPIAEHAFQGAFGRGFEIVGPIERGVINGKQRVFFASGHHETQNFSNEPGCRARLRFQDGTEALVVSRWACFNPVWSATNVRFRGTFTPQGGRPEEIPAISEALASHFGAVIREVRGGNVPAAPASSFVPGRQPVPVPEAPQRTEAPPATPTEEPKQDGKLLKLTKVQFSRDKGLNLEGDIPISVEDLKAIIANVQQSKGEDTSKSGS